MWKRFKRKFTLRRWLITIAFLGLILFAFHALGGLSRLANYFGFALSGDRGLPTRIRYQERNFTNSLICANADPCKPESLANLISISVHPLCYTKQELQRDNDWPLLKVDRVFLLSPGFSYPMLAAQSEYHQSRGKVYMLYVARGDDCYVWYALSGSW